MKMSREARNINLRIALTARLTADRDIDRQFWKYIYYALAWGAEWSDVKRILEMNGYLK